MNHSIESFIPIVLFIVIAYIIRIIMEHRTKRKLIEKGMVDENIKHLFRVNNKEYLSSLKWGMVLVGIGVAFLFGQFLPDPYSEGVSVSGALILAGIALLIFYFIEGKGIRNNPNNRP